MIESPPRIAMIVAMNKHRVIGKGNTLLWHLPGDLKRFKELTLGHPVIMGRKTFDSIISFLGKPLPGRTNIVITRDPSWLYESVVVCHSLEDAIKKGEVLDSNLFVIGGGQIYEQALPMTDYIYLTLVEDEAQGDTFFPPYEEEFVQIHTEEKKTENNITYQWIDLKRI